MAILQKLPNVFWCIIPLRLRTFILRACSTPDSLFCISMKMIVRAFFSCHPFISHSWDCVKCYKDAEKADRSIVGHHKTPFFIRDKVTLWMEASGAALEGQWKESRFRRPEFSYWIIWKGASGRWILFFIQ